MYFFTILQHCVPVHFLWVFVYLPFAVTHLIGTLKAWTD